MIRLRHLSQLDKANAKAMKLNPPLKVVGFGHYEVRGTKGDWYTVRCWSEEKEDGVARFVSCTCINAGVRKADFTCYHMAPAVGVHMLLAQARKSYNVKFD